MKLAIVLLLLLATLPSCTLIAAGVVGAAVEQQHREWCRSHLWESNCWDYYRR